MKIFYGVQGTGNGHVSRARVMARELFAAGYDVTFQFTGRPANKYFEMEIFNDYLVKDGLTFNTHKGQVSYLKTALQSNPIQFTKDMGALDLSSYDLVISDFEPVTAWAAKKQKKTVLGIGHQYAFLHEIPRAGNDLIAEQVMKYFAPVNVGIGLHWHHFGQPILPPIIETPEYPPVIVNDKILVYLPFEETIDVVNLLSPFKAYNFVVYTPEPISSRFSNIECKPLSLQGFQADLYNSAGVISNAGFELPSECLQMGKKILVKPLHAQMEQISNAAALQQLGYGQTMYDLDANTIDNWLHNAGAVQITYPNVAKEIVEWIKVGMPVITKEFIDRLWANVDVRHIDK